MTFDSLFLIATVLLFLGLIAVIFYLSNRLAQQRKELARYHLLTDTMYDIFWIMDVDSNRFVYVSPSVERMRGYKVDEIMQETVDAALTEEARLVVRKSIADEKVKFLSGEINERNYYVHQLPQPCKDGSLVWTEVVTHYFKDPVSNKVMIHGVTRDITERQKLDEKVRYLASHDPLTGVLNRNAFYEQAEMWFWEAKQNQTPLAFIHFDLNRFKQLNDTYGHHFGDEALKIFADQLRQVFSENDHCLISRFGGDEFSILVANQSVAVIESQCEQLKANLASITEIQQIAVQIQTSIGLAFLDKEDSLFELSIRADQAMYQHKKQVE